MIKFFIFSTLFVFGVFELNAQLSIGSTSPASSAILDVNASNKGFLPPRVALSSINDVATISSPATGLLVVNTSTSGTAPNNVFPGYYYFDGSKWQHIFNPSSNFIKKSILVNSAAPSSSIAGQSTISAWSGTYVASGGTVEVRANFTAFIPTNSGSRTFKLLRDGSEIDNVQFYFNQASIHTTMPDLYAILPNESGSHTFAIQIGSNTYIDFNDFATITVTETKID